MEMKQPANTAPPAPEFKPTDLILLDSLELASLLKISQRSLYKWRRDGVLPYLRIQGRIYYQLSDLFDSMEYFKHGNQIKLKRK